jgi:hypothetical protein
MVRRYIGPSFALLHAYLNKGCQGQRHTKAKVVWFLRSTVEKNDIKIHIRQTAEKVIYFQRMVKAYFAKKRLWEAVIYVEIDKERCRMRDFIKLHLRGPQRLKYEWLVEELNQLGEAPSTSADNHMKKVCKNLVQYLKDLLVLDTYHYGYVLSGAAKTFEVMDGARSNILRTRNLFVGQYGELELGKYPCRLESEAARAKSMSKEQKQRKKGSSPQPKLRDAPTLRKVDEPTTPAGLKSGGAPEPLHSFHKAKSGNGQKRDGSKRKGHLRHFNFRQLLGAARAGRLVEGGLADEAEQPESERLLDLAEVERVYGALGLSAPDVGWYDPAPHIDVPGSLSRMHELPGRLYQVHSQPHAAFRAAARKSQKKGGAYEMSQFRELVIFSLIEMTRAQAAESEAQIKPIGQRPPENSDLAV